jgi:hypothetical protein
MGFDWGLIGGIFYNRKGNLWGLFRVKRRSGKDNKWVFREIF